MFTPSPIICRIAGRPGRVAGILTITFGRVVRFQRSRAISTVRLVERATPGETSMLTKPSLPLVWLKTGRKTSAAAWMSSTIRSQRMSPGFRLARTRRTRASS